MPAIFMALNKGGKSRPAQVLAGRRLFGQQAHMPRPVPGLWGKGRHGRQKSKRGACALPPRPGPFFALTPILMP